MVTQLALFFERVMFNNVQNDLRALIDLVHKAENFDATLAANPSITSDTGYDERRRKGQRIADLMRKYDL